MSKPPIILVHGFRGSPLGLEEIAKFLHTAGYDVYAPAVPPFAGSKPLASYTTKGYANFLKDYIKEHNLKSPILIGHSMGSIIVAATADLYPNICNKKLILLSPISTKPAKLFASLTPLSALLPRRIVDYITTRYLFVPKNHKLFRRTLKITHECSNDQPPKKRDVMKSANFSAHHSIAEFDLNHKKVLLLAGAKDRLIPQKSTLSLAQKKSAQTKFIKNTGHLHNYEDPRATAEAILDFLEPKS